MATGIMSQVLLMKTLTKFSPATAMNLLFKLTAKLGKDPNDNPPQNGVPHRPVPSPAYPSLPFPSHLTNCPSAPLAVGSKRSCRVKKWLTSTPTLVLGLDVTHPTTDELRQTENSLPSIASVVGSIDMAAMRYAASVKASSAFFSFLFLPSSTLLLPLWRSSAKPRRRSSKWRSKSGSESWTSTRARTRSPRTSSSSATASLFASSHGARQWGGECGLP